MAITKINRKTIPVILHILAWVVLIVLPQIIINRYWGNNFIDWRFYINAALFGGIFYTNYLWLIPRFFYKKQKLTYFLGAVIVVVIAYILSRFTEQLLHNPERARQINEAIQKLMDDNVIPRPPFKMLEVYYFILLGVSVTGFSIGLKLIEQQSIAEKRQKELEREKLDSELAFLKNQVSPHFFFNTLNNIYSLVEINTNDAQGAILKLSKLMRYLLYESEHGETMLSAEVEFMRHYIDLMQLRVSNKVDIQINLPNNQNDLQIPPLLFIPFIENAFKHGISYRDKSFINVEMTTAKNKVHFTCKNSIAKEKKEKRDENHSGIGLENVKKRLNLLFSGKYNLNIDSSTDIFSVNLEIDTAK